MAIRTVFIILSIVVLILVVVIARIMIKVTVLTWGTIIRIGLEW